MSGYRKGYEETALGAAWSLEDYLRWQRQQEEKDENLREASNVRILARFDPECEEAVRALEEGGWGRGCQDRLDTSR
jgi:hypothetical protein